MATFNIDEMKGKFEPVDVVFRGKDYVLGRNALGLLNACELHGSIEDKDGMKYLAALLGILPDMVKSMCPELELPEDVETGEQMALVEVVKEVMARVGRLTFQKEEPEGGSA